MKMNGIDSSLMRESNWFILYIYLYIPQWPIIDVVIVIYNYGGMITEIEI